MRVPRLSVLGSFHLVSDPDQFHLFVLNILCEHLNLILRGAPILIILCLSVIFLLSQFQVLVIVPSKAALNFLKLVSQTFVFRLYLEKVLNSIVFVHSALNVL